MGRRENPVDRSRPARGRLAEHLRLRRQSAGMTYQELACLTGLSPATLKRAASGTVVPKHTTVEAYVEGCGGGPGAVRDAGELWRHARIEERGRLAQLHAPRPELISDAADLSRALEVVWEQAGAPSLRDIRDRSGNPLALPVSSAARIVNRDAVPADEQQLQAFLTGCGIPPAKHAAWLTAFARAAAPASTAAAAATSVRGSHVLSSAGQLELMRRAKSHYVSAVGDTSWKRLLELLPPETTEQIIVSGMQNYLASEAARNGTRSRRSDSWQTDLFVRHDADYTLVDFKTTSRAKRGPQGPQAGGTVPRPHRPPGGSSPAAQYEPSLKLEVPSRSSGKARSRKSQGKNKPARSRRDASRTVVWDGSIVVPGGQFSECALADWPWGRNEPV